MNQGQAAQQAKQKLAESEQTPDHVSKGNDKADLGLVLPRNQERKLWTATSLAGDMMHNIKHLEAVREP